MKYRQTGALGGHGTTPTARLREQARAVAWSPEGHWYLAGDQQVLRFDAEGALVGRWPTGLPAWSLAVDPRGRVWAGEPGRIELFDAAGHLEDTWQDDKLFGLITELVVTETDIFVADASSRWIHRFDHQRDLANHIGDQHRKGGFHIPNGVLDFAVDLDGTVVVANPGMHRVERYRPDGESLGFFGRFGQHDPQGFPGCCNPTNLALGPAGEIVVSEKAGPRVKVYDPQGELISVVAAADDFDAACKNMDLAVTSSGLIGVVDPVALQVVLFEPVAASSSVLSGTGAGS